MLEYFKEAASAAYKTINKTAGFLKEAASVAYEFVSKTAVFLRDVLNTTLSAGNAVKHAGFGIVEGVQSVSSGLSGVVHAIQAATAFEKDAQSRFTVARQDFTNASKHLNAVVENASQFKNALSEVGYYGKRAVTPLYNALPSMTTVQETAKQVYDNLPPLLPSVKVSV